MVVEVKEGNPIEIAPPPPVVALVTVFPEKMARSPIVYVPALSHQIAPPALPAEFSENVTLFAVGDVAFPMVSVARSSAMAPPATPARFDIKIIEFGPGVMKIRGHWPEVTRAAYNAPPRIEAALLRK